MRSCAILPLALAVVALTTAGCSSSKAKSGPEAQAPAPTGALHEVTILGPSGPPTVPTDKLDPSGKPIALACSSCHSVRAADPTRRDGATLDQFHQGLKTKHGDLTCLSCHDSSDYDRLRLADMTPVAFSEVKTLCRQCHGPQVRDYDNGAHGGMRGYWDLHRGPRTRNGCTTCHDPHAPAFPSVHPAPGPIDRFARPGTGGH